MREETKNKSSVIWIVVVIGVAGLVTAAILMRGSVPVPVTIRKHIEAPSLVPVAGTVTLDGKPLKGAFVQFLPIIDSTTNLGMGLGLTSYGFTDADGKYALIYAIGDGNPVMGAVIGPHQVQILLKDPTNGQLVPGRYGGSQSELKADVANGTGPINFTLTSDPVEKPD